MKATFSCLALVLAAFLSSAFHAEVSSAKTGPNDVVRTWSVSGSELISALERRPDSGALAGYADETKAAAKGAAYIAGVADATSASSWCGAGSILPHELTDRVYAYLRTVPPERLKGNASTLVIEGLADSFPCAADK